MQHKWPGSRNEGLQNVKTLTEQVQTLRDTGVNFQWDDKTIVQEQELKTWINKLELKLRAKILRLHCEIFLFFKFCVCHVSEHQHSHRLTVTCLDIFAAVFLDGLTLTFPGYLTKGAGRKSASKSREQLTFTLSHSARKQKISGECPDMTESSYGLCSVMVYSLLLKAHYQPVIQNILLWLPSAVPEQGGSNIHLIHISGLLWGHFKSTQRKASFQENEGWDIYIKFITYFIAHPFHFTRYSILPCKKKEDRRWISESSNYMTLKRDFEIKYFKSGIHLQQRLYSCIFVIYTESDPAGCFSSRTS